jgi:hypothetical protein
LDTWSSYCLANPVDCPITAKNIPQQKKGSAEQITTLKYAKKLLMGHEGNLSCGALSFTKIVNGLTNFVSLRGKPAILIPYHVALSKRTPENGCCDLSAGSFLQ